MNTVATPEGSTLSARVRAEWALPVTRFVFVIVVSTGVALWWLGRFHVVAKEPLWLIVGVVGIGYLCSWTAHLSYVTAPSRRRLHVRIAVQVTLATALMYLTGWGPALTLAFVIIARDNLTVAEGNPWPEIAAWVAAAVVAGQTAISFGLAPTFVPLPDEYGLAVLTALATLFVIGLLGISAGHLAAAEDSLRHSEERLRTTLETANDAYVEIDESGIVTDWNSQSEVLFGWTRSEAIRPSRRGRHPPGGGSQREPPRSRSG